MDHLEVSIRYAKFVLAYQQDSGRSDPVKLRGKLADVRRKMKDFSTMKSKLTKLQNGVGASVDDIKSLLESTKGEIEKLIGEMESLFVGR